MALEAGIGGEGRAGAAHRAVDVAGHVEPISGRGGAQAQITAAEHHLHRATARVERVVVVGAVEVPGEVAAGPKVGRIVLDADAVLRVRPPAVERYHLAQRVAEVEHARAGGYSQAAAHRERAAELPGAADAEARRLVGRALILDKVVGSGQRTGRAQRAVGPLCHDAVAGASQTGHP